MPTTYFCGKFGSVLIDGVAYPLTNWELTSRVTTPAISNFTVPLGQEMYCPNLIGGEITCEGFLTSVGVPSAAVVGLAYPTSGTYAVFTLGYGPGLNYTVNGLINEITPSDDVEDVARFTVSAVISPDPATL